MSLSSSERLSEQHSSTAPTGNNGLPALLRSKIPFPESAPEKFLRAANLTIPTSWQRSVHDAPFSDQDILKSKYFGPCATAKGHAIFRKLAMQTHHSESEKKSDTTLEPSMIPKIALGETSSSPSQLSARHKFTSLCLNLQLPPCLRLIIRKTYSPELNISHMSIGDELASVFAACLSDLPLVSSLNVRDNRLSDEGLQAILRAAQTRKDLFSLDVSENTFDTLAAKAMSTYLCSESCALRTLVLARANVHDTELCFLARALHTNATLAYLDLSNNKIGSNEMLNAIRPSQITGGEAIATMLTVNSTLTYLDLSWNFLKDDTAVEIGNVLSYNCGLRELNLSYNAFGNAGTQAITEALLTNDTLESLHLANNNVPYQAALAISSALKVNKRLIRLTLDGNPLGLIAGRSLLHAIAACKGRRLYISMENCNFDLSVPQSFDPANPTGTYDLDLSIPYERAIALELLQIANTRKGSKFLSFCHRTMLISRQIRLELRQLEASANAIEPNAPDYSSWLKDTASLERLFEQLDTAKLGYLDVHGLKKGLQLIRVHASEDELSHYFAYYDLDGSERIELLEFIDFMQSFHLKPIDSASLKLCVVDLETKEPFIIPRTGRAVIEFLDLHLAQENDASHSKQGIENMIDAIGSSKNKAALLKIARTGMYFKLDQAERLANDLKDSLDAVQIVTLLLPHLVEYKSTYVFLTRQFRDDAMRLAVQKGSVPLFGVLLGLGTRHYRLDLTKELHRSTIQKLMAISTRIATHRKANKLKDTSQHGNFHGFRNEMLNGNALVLTPLFFEKLPKFGLLEFDFVQMERVPRRVMSKKLFEGILQRFCSQRHANSALGAESQASAERLETIKDTQLSRGCLFSIDVYRHLDTMYLTRSSSHSSPQGLSPRNTSRISETETDSDRFAAPHLLYDVEWMLANRHITCAQAIQLLQYWPAELQSSKIDAICMFFDRIVDLHYFSNVLLTLTDHQAAQCLYRLGWLNIWTPLMPDNYYELCLSRYEEREIAKILVRLAVVEPGENWKRQSFGWTLHELIPGWELNLSWLQTGNFPDRGYLKLQYYSGADKDCKMKWSSRIELAQSTLCGIPHNIQEIQAQANAISLEHLHA